MSFQLYDSMLYQGKPKSNELGLIPVKLLYRNTIWKLAQGAELPDPDYIRSLAKSYLAGTTVILDIEHWKLDEANREESISKLKTTISYFKSANESIQIGLYILIPFRNYYASIADPDSVKYKDWQKDNDALIPLLYSVDVLVPSIYVLVNKPDQWVTYATNTIRECRRLIDSVTPHYGKFIYPFLWPQFHPNTRELSHTFIPGDFWRLQLETLKSLGTDLRPVIWGSSSEVWDPSREWWQETQNFLANNQ